MTSRVALSLVAFALASAAPPALAACSRFCDEPGDLGGSLTDDHAAARPGHHPTPIVEMSLPSYLWLKLRAEAHDAADKAAFAIITATSRLAVVAAHEKQDRDAAGASHAAPPPGPAREECPAGHAPPV